jgi:dihydrofolate reductase
MGRVKRSGTMRKLVVFNYLSLDGYFTGLNGDFSWVKDNQDAEFLGFVEANVKGGGELLFGRTTYEMMAGFWPTPLAREQYPVMAERMNNLPKVVFSRTLKEASWSHTRLVKGDLAAEIRTLKNEPGEGLVILGSGSIVAQLAPMSLIDEYQILVYPVVLGRGKTMFDGLREKLALKLTKTRTFGNGIVLLHYVPRSEGGRP